VEEERRLFYVGITRAMEELVLTKSLSRRKFGKLVPTQPSRFLAEIPEELLKKCSAKTAEPSSPEDDKAYFDAVRSMLQGPKPNSRRLG